MASIIRIKRSETSGNPSVLGAGELAYSALLPDVNNGGGRLYIGAGNETLGDAASHVVIGGKYFTDMLDQIPGVLTANSAILVDADKKIDNLKVDNIDFNGNTISTTNVNGNLVLSPNGFGSVIINGNNFPINIGTAKQVMTADGTGLMSWEHVASGVFTITADVGTNSFEDDQILSFHGSGAISTSLTDTSVTFSVAPATTSSLGVASFNATNFSVNGGNVALSVQMVAPDTYGSTNAIPVITVNGNGVITSISTASISTALDITADTGSATIALATDTITFAGSGALSSAITQDTVTYSVADATTTTKGVASFDASSFVVSSGAVSFATGGITNTSLEYSTVTIGSTTIDLGGSSTILDGLTDVTVGVLNFTGADISTVSGDLSISPATDVVAFNNSRLTGLAQPIGDDDAATKIYVDNRISGLTWKDAVNVLSKVNVPLSGTAASITALNIDSHGALSNGYRLLLAGQTADEENGIYVYNVAGTKYTLTRDIAVSTYSELIGSAVFVLEGTQYAKTGWVQSNHYVTDFTAQTWIQFSGAGTFVAGIGISLVNGTTFKVDIDSVTNTGGLDFTNNQVALAASVAGNGLSLAAGVLTVNVAPTGGIELVQDSLQLQPSVSGAGLTLTSGVLDIVGTADRITINSDSIDIASTYVGQPSITTLGTITTGTWTADTIIVEHGGTGITSYAAGDLLYAIDANTLVKLPAGEPGQQLTMDAAGLPIWTHIDGGSY